MPLVLAVKVSFKVALKGIIIEMLSVHFEVVCFRGQMKLEPRPDRSPFSDEHS